MYMPSEEPSEPQPERPAPVYFDELIVELAQAVADMTRVVDYLASTKTLPNAVAAANERLHEFLKRLQG